MIFTQSRAKKRTLESYIIHGNEKKYGLKGQSYLTNFLDLPNAMLIDYMHLICLGLFRNMMFFWFDKSNSKFDFYLGIEIILVLR